MPRLGTPINGATRCSISLAERIFALQKEACLFFDECSKLQQLDVASVVERMDKVERRITMLRHGVTLVRSEAKLIVRTKKAVQR